MLQGLLVLLVNQHLPQLHVLNLVCFVLQLVAVPVCSFKMQEVRTDAAKYPYLLLPSLSKWQECSINNNNKQLEQKGLECLGKAAAQPSVVILTSQLVINVIISSSPHRPSCSGEQDITCNHTIWGYAQADGPWFNAGTADPNYQEGDSAGNWLWLRFTELDVGGRNNANVWEAGGNTFAHEVRVDCAGGPGTQQYSSRCRVS